MTEFKWNLTTEERPREGKGNYVIIGPKGGMYFVTEYVVLGEKYGPGEWFKDTRGNLHYPEEVKAWAEIPPFGSDDTCHNVAAPPEEGFWPMPHFECSVCGKYYATSDYVYFCPSCGRKVVQR